MDPSQLLDTMMVVTEDMLARTVELNARCDALEGLAYILAHRQGLDKDLTADILRRSYNQFYSERLLEISRTNPALAGRIDRREKHEEGLSDDEKFLRFDRPEGDQPQG